MRHAVALARLLRQQSSSLKILGPAPAALPRIDKQYRWHIVVKDLKRRDPSSRQLHIVINKAVDGYRQSPLGRGKSVRLIIDVDPVGMM